MSIPLIDQAVAAVYPLVSAATVFLTPVGGAVATIILCTAALRLLLLPLTIAAVRGERSRAALAPQLAALQRRQATDPARLRTELAALHQKAGVSPLAGCLPMLAQSPVFLVWYRIFTAPQVGGHPNVLLTHRFLDAALSSHLIGDGHPLVFVPLLIILAGLGLLALRRSRRVAAATGAAVPRGPLMVLPFASLLSALVMPLAALLYLVTTLSWTAVETAVLRRGLPAG